MLLQGCVFSIFMYYTNNYPQVMKNPVIGGASWHNSMPVPCPSN